MHFVGAQEISIATFTLQCAHSPFVTSRLKYLATLKQIHEKLFTEFRAFSTDIT